MSYCTLEEAFNNYIEPENTNEQCKKKNMKRKKKINCNRNKETETWENSLELNNPSHYNSNHSKPFETFDNYQPNEIFEYSESDNKPINNTKQKNRKNKKNIVVDNSSDIEDSSDNDNSDNDNSDSDNYNTIKQNNNTSNSLLTSQVSEINNKINFLMNQISNKEVIENDNNKLENNIHDIILFILFGIFVILILEVLYKLSTKITTNKFNDQYISSLINNATLSSKIN